MTHEIHFEEKVLEEMISLVPVTLVYGLMNSIIIKMVMEIVE